MPLQIGDLVETRIISGTFKNQWIQATITKINRHAGRRTYNLKVVDFRRFHVHQFAEEVPEKLLRKARQQPIATQITYRMGEIVETQILSGRWAGTWIKAKVIATHRNGKYDIETINPKKYNVAKIGVSVPASFLRQVQRMKI